MSEEQSYTVENHAADLLGNDLSGVETPAVPEVTPPVTPPETPPVVTTGTPAATPDVVEYNPVIEQMRSTFAQQGIEVEIPDDFKGTEVPADKVYNFINETLQNQQQSSDPIISQWNKAKADGLDANQFIQQKVEQQQLLGLESKEFMTRLYRARNGKTEQNPSGYTDEAIQEHLNKMSPIELDEQATSYKAKLSETFNKATPQSQSPEVISQQVETSNKEAEKIATKLFTDMSQRSEIGGMPHTQADIDDFKPVFTDMVMKNPETGKTRVQELLSNDKTLYDVLYAYHKMNGGGLKTYLSQFKESYKAEILEKTGLRPNTTAGNTYTVSVPKPEDFA